MIINHKNKSADTSDTLFHENEILTNTMALKSLLLFSLLEIVFAGLSLTGILEDDSRLSVMLVFYAFFLAIACGIVKKIGYQNQHSKYILIIALILNSGVVYFLYPITTMFLIFGPTLLSIRYYDKKFTLSVSVLSYAVFLITIILNYNLDYIPDIHQLHVNQGFINWLDFKSIMYYWVFLKTAIYLLTAFISCSIADAGKRIVSKQITTQKKAISMETELDMAANIMVHNEPLPDFRTSHGELTISAFMKPARNVGGDFYDYFMVDENVMAVMVGDASDKGLGAAMFVVKARSALRFALCSESFTDKVASIGNLENVINLINNQITSNNPDGMFVTLWIGCIDLRTGVGKYVNAGHVPPMILHKDGSIEPIENDPQVFIGAFMNADLKSGILQLKDGDTLLTYTDGVTDARNIYDETFDCDRIKKALTDTASKSDYETRDIICSLVSFLDNHIGETEQFDDITALAVKFKGNCDITAENMKYEGKSENIPLIINDVNNFLRSNNCPDDVRRNLDSVIDDICTNITDYAYEECDGDIEVYCTIGKNFTIITFSDSGPEFNPLEVNDSEERDILQIGGLGIHLIRNLTDKCYYEYTNEKNNLTIVKIWNI